MLKEAIRGEAYKLTTISFLYQSFSTLPPHFHFSLSFAASTALLLARANMQLIRLFVSFAGLVATASAVDIRLCKDQNLGGACYATTIASGSCCKYSAKPKATSHCLYYVSNWKCDRERSW